MEKTEKHVIWQPNEEIYKAGDNPEGAYLIKSGYVYIYTSGGLKLNRLGVNEIFGDASLVLKKPRSVTAIAGEQACPAQRSKGIVVPQQTESYHCLSIVLYHWIRPRTRRKFWNRPHA